MFKHLISSSPWPDKASTRTAVGPFYGSAEARCVAELASHHERIVVFVSDTSNAIALERELPFFLTQETELLSFPDWEILPYDHFSPHQDIVSERLRTLYRLPKMARGILIVPVSTAMHRLPPIDYIASNALQLGLGDEFDAVAFRQQLLNAGYVAVDTVYEHGEFALRGSILDVFPMGSSVPYRIDTFDADVDTIRTFDPETQRTIEAIERIDLLPAREFPLTKGALNQFMMNWYEAFDVDHDACPIYREVLAGRVPGGTEYFLPLFFKQTASLFDFLPEGTALVTVGDHHQSSQRFWQDVVERHEEYGIDPRRPLLPPQRIILPADEFYGQIKRFATLELRRNPDAPVHFNTDSKPLPSFISEASTSPVEPLKRWIETHCAGTLLVAETAGRREALIDALQRIGLQADYFEDWQSFEANPVTLGIATAPIDRGMYFGPNAPCLVAEAQLYGQKVAQRRRRSDTQHSTDEAFRHINELHEGTPVVHLEHGVGRYEGLQTLSVAGETNEFITLIYAEGAKLYVPVASLHLISRYAGADGDSAPLHRLGSDQWEKARKKASERASDVAAQLLEVYARREARKGFTHKLDPLDYERFCSGFPFEETPDQALAIEAVRNDMCAQKVMDRLVCGDVGFGKTEVAMRAAFIASHNNKQVAVLVPTTLLAQQHYHSFCDRFAGWDVKVAVVSRFNSASQNKAIMADLASGKIDILVGTHKLLSPDVKFADLGLLIIDEEHRFGVKQKETLKALRTEVDILTLTATPIPRTLNMALGGMRDLSVIATPPAKRLSIKTFVREHNTSMIKEAILRETLRGGQVYYLHNEVKTIEETARKLQAMVPDLKVAVAHGQQHETELERVMSDFYHQRFHILVCTTIIETGIDVPNANTIIMDRADRLGLAQLHQLRGRVGRSHHQAYAYLFCPPRSGLTKDAEKRLEAIEAAGDLGAGYLLATQDLEIRGAGELLGDDQSGQIHSVGFSLYLKMLERAVAALKRGELPNVDTPLEQGSEVNLQSSALIPEDYLPDINTRLVLYRRVGAAQTQQQLRDLQVEMIDRFGLLPEPVKTLFISAEVRIEAEQAGISSVDVGETSGSLQFMDNTKVDPLNLVTMVQKDPKRYQLAGANKLKFQCELTSPRDRADFIITLCKQLTQTRAAA